MQTAALERQMCVPPSFLQTERLYTCEDYFSWDERFRCELIDGRVFVDGQRWTGPEPPKSGQYFALPEVYAVPAPTTKHQKISVNLSSLLWFHLRKRKETVLCAPTDVRLFPLFRDTVVQPDVFIVCDPSKMTLKRCEGAPDFVAEILSPTTAKHDIDNKLANYISAGVREIWLIDQSFDTITTVIDGLPGKAYHIGDNIPILGDFEISVEENF